MSNEKLRPGQKIKMISYDELCGGGTPSTDVIAGETTININLIDDFENHPFKVLDDAKMDELVESIEENGILSPVIVRSKLNGRYELISGHRRRHAAVRAGLTEIPAIVKELDDEAAIILMVDANIQREEILPSERAKSLKMKMDALEKQKADGRILGNKKRELVGEDSGISGRQVQRYITLNSLIPDLLDKVDAKKIAMNMALELAVLRIDVQTWINTYIDMNGAVSIDTIRRIKEVDDTEGITQDVADYILNEQNYKAKVRKLTISEKKLNSYFTPDYSLKEIEEIVLQLLDEWKWSQEADNE